MFAAGFFEPSVSIAVALPTLLLLLAGAVLLGHALAQRANRPRLQRAEAETDEANREAQQAKAQAGRLQQQLRDSQQAHEKIATDARVLRTALLESEARAYAGERDRQAIFAAGRKLYLDRNALRESLSQTQIDLELQNRTVRQVQRRMRAALRLEGQLWNARALTGRPKFRPLERRQRAIISVLNLKGGVGKTTVTAHLGRALAVRGYRVLLIDMDLQGSLTSMMLDHSKLAQAAADERLLQHFLQKAVDDKRTKILDYTFEVFQHPEGGSLDIVGTSDSLAYAELNLTLRWLVGKGERDSRFLLRKALHLMSVSDRYDVVLIDCPPLVNISCVNALAASDFVLIPTTMGRKSRERVPPTIKRILRNEKFLKYVNHDLRVLGVVANRTHRLEMTGIETSDWEQLAKWCREAMGGPVRFFESNIPDTSEMREFETAFAMPKPESRVASTFGSLAAEMEKELPCECRRTAKSSS